MSDLKKPKNVATGVTILYVSLVIGVIAAIMRGVHMHVIEPHVQPAMLEHNLMAYALVCVIFLVVAWFIYYKISHGKNWARIVFLIVLLVGLVSNVMHYQMILDQHNFMVAASVINIILTVVAACLLFSKEANAWFAHD